MTDNRNENNEAPLELSPDEASFIADNLAACAEYLEHLDTLWLGADNDTEVELPELDGDTSEMLRAKVFTKIHRENITASTLRLGTEGIMQVLLALVRPALSSKGKDADKR